MSDSIKKLEELENSLENTNSKDYLIKVHQSEEYEPLSIVEHYNDETQKVEYNVVLGNMKMTEGHFRTLEEAINDAKRWDRKRQIEMMMAITQYNK